ncbi:MAG: hypothetical protein RL059_789 [Bacteroidota bacterium]|jgi:hypothetical protein
MVKFSSKLLFVLFAFTFANSGISQKLLKPSTPVADSFPTISGELWYRGFGSSALTKEQLSISENGKKVEFSLTPIAFKSDAPKNKKIVFLIENHWLPIGIAERKFFNEVISRGIRNSINPGDQVMVASFDWYRDGKYIYQETNGYTDDISEILSAVSSIKAKKRNQSQIGSDINQSLMETLRFINQSNDSMPAAIFLFSDEMDNIVGKIQSIDIKIESIKSNIPIYALSYFNASRYGQIIKNEICQPSYGSYYASKSNNVDSSALRLSMFLDGMIENSRGSLYAYSYKTELKKDKQSAELSFEVKSLPNAEKITLLIPTKSILEWIIDNKITSTASVLGFILLIIFIVIYIKQSKKKLLQQKEELQKTQVELQNQAIKADNEKKETNARLLKIQQEQIEKENENERAKSLKEEKKEEERLTKLMLLKGAFPKLSYSYQGNNGSIEVNCPVFTIGRETTNMFYIQLNTVSKKHAVIKFHENGTYSITDTGSSNGTMVNGEKISETTLKSGDFIQIGDIGITFQN